MKTLTSWGLPLLALVCFVRLWLMPIGSSFWVDEMATIFVVEHGAADPSLAVAPQVPQSIYYSFLRDVVSGRSEIAHRLPSIFFMALALVFIGALIGRLIHPDAWWFAVFACFSLKGINYEAGNARPYAMGVCVACAALYFLVLWFDEKQLRSAVGFAILAALLWRIHLIFWPFYVVFALYALMRWKDMPWWQIVTLFGIVGVLLIPVALRAITLNAQAKEHVVVDEPGMLVFSHALRPLLVLAALSGAWIWSRIAKEKQPAIATPTIVLFLAWWLWNPIALFAFSWITGNSVFVPRYLALSIPGTAVAATLSAAWFLPPRFWKCAAIAMGIAALIAAGNWKQLWPTHHNSDWRGAAQAVNRLALETSTPVICPSPFIEARPPVWTPDYKMPGFLYSHLLVYPVQGNAALFPFADSPEAEDYALSLLHGPIPASGKFVIYGGHGGASFWKKWFQQRPELARWTARSLGQFQDVDAVLFERP